MATLLLVDDHHVLYRSGTERVQHHPVRHEGNPVIAADRPWEGDVAWTSVFRDPSTGRYQLWYQAYAGRQAPQKQCATCYAESDDGLIFVKPEFDMFPWGDIPRTNIVMVGNGGKSIRYCNSVLVDDRMSDPAMRYKMAYFDFSSETGREYPGLHVAFSPDGIHWKRPDVPMPLQTISYGDLEEPLPLAGEPGNEWNVPLSMADAVDVFRDPVREEYVDYAKMWIDGPAGDTRWKHAMGRIASRDFIHWTKPELILTPDDEDLPHVEFHTTPVFYHAGCYFSLVQILNRAERGGVIDIELMLSRDGFRWERPFRKEFFFSREDALPFEWGSIFTNSTPVILDDEIRFYYGAYSAGATGDVPGKLESGIGLATIPRDRFAGIRPVAVSDQPTLSEPLHDVGQVTMKPLDLNDCAGITLNADASDGAIRVELLDENGYRLPGFTREDAVPITGDSLRHPVRWKERSVGDVSGKAMLRIHLERAELFAVETVER